MSENVAAEDSVKPEEESPSTKSAVNEEENSSTTTIKEETSTQKYNDSSSYYSQFSHPVYKKISAANGRINRMSKDDLIDALKYLGLNPK